MGETGTGVAVERGRPVADTASDTGRWWPDTAVRLTAGAALFLIVGIAVVEGIAPGASIFGQLALAAVIAAVAVLGVVRAALRRRARRPAPAWWRPGAVTVAVVAFVGFPWLAFPGTLILPAGEVAGMAAPLRANLALSRPALRQVIAEIERTGRIPDGLPTKHGDPAVRIGGFAVEGVGASCALHPGAGLSKADCPDGVSLSLWISGDGPLTDFATFLVYCARPGCNSVGSSRMETVLDRHWSVDYPDYSSVAGIQMYAASLALGAVWLVFLVGYTAVRLSIVGIVAARHRGTAAA